MRIIVIPAGAAPFQVEVDETSQVGQLKETIESMMANQFWTAVTMSLFYQDVELVNASTLQENNIAEMCTLHAVAFDAAQYEGTLSFPTSDAEMFANSVDDSSRGNTDFTIDELLGIQNESVAVKMILPHTFQANLALNNSGTHNFQNCGQLRDKIESDAPAWLPKLEAYAILSNVDAFLVENVDDYVNRKNGGLALVRSSDYGDALKQGRAYKFSVDAPMSISIEKSAGKLKISGEIHLDRFEIVGDLWIRRRMHVTGDDTFSLIQWMSAPSKKKESVKEEVSHVGKAVGELKLQLDTVATDVTDIKKDMASFKQGLTDIQTTLAAIVGMLPQPPPPGP